MAVILNIETSTDVCSVALSSDGYILHHREDFNGPNHAAVLSDFIADSLNYLESHGNMHLDAVGVSIGPGSYTGLRIGLSEAKGLAYALFVPLIGINTLEIIAAQTMFAFDDFNPDTDLFQPMIDARRDEVYTATYNAMLECIKPAVPVILTADYNKDSNEKRIIYSGNGVTKAMRILEPRLSNIFIEGVSPLATGMLPISEKAWQQKQFIDIAYSVPLYLKDFQASTPKNKLSQAK